MMKVNVLANRHATFSKRRKGIENKAMESVTLTCLEVVTIVFSPEGKVFSFGHPSVDVHTVTQQFLGSVTSGGPLFDPKREKIATEFPNSWVSFDPMVSESSNQVQSDYPRVLGLDSGVPLDSSTIEAETGFNWMSLATGSQVPLDLLIHGFDDFGASYDPILGGYDNMANVDPNLGENKILDRMSVIGSSSQVALDHTSLVFDREAPHPYDPIEVEFSKDVSFDQMGMGFDDDNGLSFNLVTFGFQDGWVVD